MLGTPIVDCTSVGQSTSIADVHPSCTAPQPRMVHPLSHSLSVSPFSLSLCESLTLSPLLSVSPDPPPALSLSLSQNSRVICHVGHKYKYVAQSCQPKKTHFTVATERLFSLIMYRLKACLHVKYIPDTLYCTSKAVRRLGAITLFSAIMSQFSPHNYH